jgi:hypothetical protein
VLPTLLLAEVQRLERERQRLERERRVLTDRLDALETLVQTLTKR